MGAEADKTEGHEALGRNLVRGMGRAGVRAKDLTERFGVAYSTVGNWKHRGVPPVYAEQVADMLGVKPEQISRITPEQRQVAGETAAPSLAVAPLDPFKQRLIELIEDAQLTRTDVFLLENLVLRLSG